MVLEDPVTLKEYLQCMQFLPALLEMFGKQQEAGRMPELRQSIEKV